MARRQAPSHAERRWIVAIKSLHTAVLVVMSGSVGFVLYSGVTGQRGNLLWVAIGLIAFEGVVLLLNGVRCPLTTLAKRLGDETGDDYLSGWLFERSAIRSIVPVCSGLFLLGLLLVVVSALRG